MVRCVTIASACSVFFILSYLVVTARTQKWISRSSQLIRTCKALNEDGKNFLLDPDSNKCFETGTQGPCSEMMIFYPNPLQPNSPFGFCDCEQGYQSEFTCSDSPIRKRVYIPERKRCYTVFSQGPCKEGQWLILLEGSRPICTINQCDSYGISRAKNDQFWFYEPTRKNCYLSLTQGYCQSDFTLELVHDSQYPKCQKRPCLSYPNVASGVRSNLRCSSGTRFSFVTRSCLRSFRGGYGIG